MGAESRGTHRNARRRFVTVTLSLDEYEQITRHSIARSMSVAEAGRRMILAGLGRDVPAPDRCSFCSGAVKKHGHARGRQRVMCKRCGRTVMGDSLSTRGNHIPEDKEALLQECLASGMSIRKAALLSGTCKRTAGLRAAELGKLTCPCGLNARHQGWCSWRISQSAARQTYLASVTKPSVDELEDKLGRGLLLLVLRMLDKASSAESIANVTGLDSEIIHRVSSAVAPAQRRKLLASL